MTWAIEARGLERRYRTGALGGWRVAVRGVDLRVAEGDGLAILGPNGAGKSTLLAMLAGLRRPTAGTVAVNGTFGLLPERPALLGGRLREVLRLYARLQGVSDREADGALDRLHLLPWADTPTDALSQGARQRAALAQALLGAPRVLLLDEPLTNLDPEAARIVLDVLGEERDRGATLVVATHHLAALAEVCGKVARMSDGQLRMLGPADQILAHLPTRVVYLLPAGAAEPREGVLARTSGELRVRTASAGRRDVLLAEIRDAGGSVLRVEPAIEHLAGAPDVEETLA